MGACTFVVMAVSFWCAIRAYDEQGSPIGFYHVMLTLFAGVLIPCGLSALVMLKCMEHGKYLVVLQLPLGFHHRRRRGLLRRGISRASPGRHPGQSQQEPRGIYRADS